MANTQTPVAEDLPEVDFSELDDQHFKTYVSKSLKRAVQKYARSQQISDSEAGRELLLIALQTVGAVKPATQRTR